jgi:chalcone isomerase-like protein
MRIALALLVAAVPAVAKEHDGVVVPATIQVDGKPLQLMGMGLRKKLWVRVYLASLYLENPTEDAKQVIATDQIKRVQMNMLRDLDRGKIVEAVQQGFERNSGQQLPRLRERLDRFLRAIPDLRGGQTIVITYFPGRGTSLKAGSGEDVSIAGKDFADALFSVWLGDNPVDGDLKAEMLVNR